MGIVIVISYWSRRIDSKYRFLGGLKATYKNKEIEIIVCEVDETEYLLKSAANKQKLMQAIENIENKTSLVEINLEDME